MKLSPEVKKQLARIVGLENIQTDDVALALFAYDCSVSRTKPDGVVFIRQVAHIAPVVRVLSQHKIPFVPRASATNHAGSCAALQGGVILNLTGLRKIIEINRYKRRTTFKHIIWHKITKLIISIQMIRIMTYIILNFIRPSNILSKSILIRYH